MTSMAFTRTSDPALVPNADRSAPRSEQRSELFAAVALTHSPSDGAQASGHAPSPAVLALARFLGRQAARAEFALRTETGLVDVRLALLLTAAGVALAIGLRLLLRNLGH